MHCNHAINMDMTSALGAICLAEAALELFQQACLFQGLHAFWPAITGNIINVNAATSARKPGTQIDPSITYSDNVYSALPHFAVIHSQMKALTKRWQRLESNNMAQKQAFFTQGFSFLFWWGRWLPWVTSGWNQLYKLFKRPSLVFTGMRKASMLPRYRALFCFMFLHQTFSFY